MLLIMKRTLYAVALTSICLLLAALAYHLITPKIQLENLSNHPYRTLNIELPTNKISFEPIPANSTQTIYFSPQKTTGELRYTLEDEHGSRQTGQLAYVSESEYFSVIQFRIERDGRLSVSK